MADYEAPDMRKPITRETTIGYPPVIGLVGHSSLLMWWFPKLLLHKMASFLCWLTVCTGPTSTTCFAWPPYACNPRATCHLPFSPIFFDFEKDFPKLRFVNNLLNSIFLNNFKSPKLSSLEFLGVKIPFSIKFGRLFLFGEPLLNFLCFLKMF